MINQKVCSVCGNEFWTRGNRGKYCSPECRKVVNSLRVSQKQNSKKGKISTKKLVIRKKPLLNIIDTYDKKQIGQVICLMECTEDSECYKSALKSLCRARDIGLETFVECLEEDPHKCKFSVSFGDSYFCKSPLRVHVAKKLNKRRITYLSDLEVGSVYI